MKKKTLVLEDNVLKGIVYKVEREGVEESKAIKDLLKLGLQSYIVELYKAGQITLAEAAELSGVSLRRMLDILLEQGVKGNVTLNQQIRALEYAGEL